MEKDLTLTHVSVLFADTTNSKGYGKSITIDCTEPDVELLIKKWAEANNYTSLKIKDYTNKDGSITKQVNFKINEYTNIDGKDGATEKDLGWGAKVNLIVRAFPYSNNFGEGISSAISNLFIVEKCKSKMASIAE